MKNWVFAIVLVVITAMPALSGEVKRQWFFEGLFAVDMSDDWTILDQSEASQMMLMNKNFPNQNTILINLPMPMQTLSLAKYPGARVGVLGMIFQKHGQLRPVREQAIQFDGHPALGIEFIIDRDGKSIIEGLVLGVDYGGYFTTIAITGTVETLEQFMPLAQEVVKSFRFNESVAKKNSEIIASIGQQVEGEFIEILGE